MTISKQWLQFIMLWCLSISLASCDFSPPSNEELIAKYTSNPKGYERLAEMIKKDFSELANSSQGCLTIGQDQIREFWYSSVANDWSSTPTHEYKKTLSEVLSKVGLSSQRYEKYLELFRQTGSERITLCSNDIPSSGVHVLIFRSGTTMGGWGAEINKRDDGGIPDNTSSRCCDTKNFKIRDGWYLSVSSES